MILGFAHLGINTSNIEETQRSFIDSDYIEENSFIGLKNHINKKPFLKKYNNRHDIKILKNNNRLTVEITNHGEIHGLNNQLELSNDKTSIILSVPDLKLPKKILTEGLGFKEEKNRYFLESLIPSWSCNIVLMQKDSQETMLDNEGPSCLAFYVRNIQETLNTLVLCGAINYSAVFCLTTNMSLKIAMLRVPGGPVLELIEVDKDNGKKNN